MSYRIIEAMAQAEARTQGLEIEYFENEQWQPYAIDVETGEKIVFNPEQNRLMARTFLAMYNVLAQHLHEDFEKIDSLLNKESDELYQTEKILDALKICLDYLDNPYHPHTSPNGVTRKKAIKAIKEVYKHDNNINNESKNE